MEKPIDKLVNEIEDYANKTDIHFLKKIDANYKKLIYMVHSDAVRQYSKGYCMRMMVPEKDVNSTFNSIPNMSLDKIGEAFKTQWVVPAEAHMHNSSYYHVLLLTHLIAVRNKLDDLSKNSISLILFRIWNGRIIGAIKYCDPDTMNYVTNIMMNNKFKAKLYPSPFEMICEYFTPTINNFYTKNVLSDSTETKRLFEQCYARIKQVFRSNPIMNLKSGERKYSSGLQPFYYKAKEQGLKLSVSKGGTSSSSEDYDIGDNFSSSVYEEQINNVTIFIVMNHNPQYDEKFLNFIIDEIRGLNKQSTIKLLSCYHDLKYHDLVEELLQNMFRRFGSISQSTICSDTFYKDIIQSRIISSKHTQDVINIKDLADSLLADIFETKYEKKFDYKSISDTQKSVYRKIIIYGLAYNIKKRLCA